MKSYTDWYYYNFKTQDFNGPEDFADTVGERPSEQFSLARVGNVRGVPMTPHNFVWVTDDAIKAAKAGAFRPPKLPGRTAEEQAVNDSRFHAHVSGMMEYSKRKMNKYAVTEKWRAELSQLMDMIESYVVERGYPASQAMNPNILPADEYPKLNKGREMAQTLMRYLAGDYNKIHRLKKLAELKKEQRRKEQEERMINNANRVYTGKRGRPMEKFVKKRVRISDLTPEQRKAYNIPLGQDYTNVRNETTGRNNRVWTVMVDVPNPKLQQVA